jgi:hypothetical protein
MVTAHFLKPTVIVQIGRIREFTVLKLAEPSLVLSRLSEYRNSELGHRSQRRFIDLILPESGVSACISTACSARHISVADPATGKVPRKRIQSFAVCSQDAKTNKIQASPRNMYYNSKVRRCP